jgi:hypothetical protein
MWMIPFTEGQNHTLTVDFPQTQLISGLRVWNYNKSREDTYRGVSKQLLSNLCINSLFFYHVFDFLYFKLTEALCNRLNIGI